MLVDLVNQQIISLKNLVSKLNQQNNMKDFLIKYKFLIWLISLIPGALIVLIVEKIFNNHFSLLQFICLLIQLVAFIVYWYYIEKQENNK